MDGISRGYNVFLRRLDYDARNIARYSTDAAGVGVNFGLPISETQRINFGVLAEYTEITEGYYAAQEISEFIEINGSTSVNLKANVSWSRSTLNRGIFADRGSSQSIAAEISVPGSELQFYKFIYNGERYFQSPTAGLYGYAQSWVMAEAMATRLDCLFTNIFTVAVLDLSAGSKIQHWALAVHRP